MTQTVTETPTALVDVVLDCWYRIQFQPNVPGQPFETLRYKVATSAPDDTDGFVLRALDVDRVAAVTGESVWVWSATAGTVFYSKSRDQG